jgi:acyl-coenzyme A synthetase/AMP-(fatty) acid ligase
VSRCERTILDERRRDLGHDLGQDRADGAVDVVVPRPGAGPDPDELLVWVAERVEPHERVRAVRFADAIPRTASGKLLRRALADQDRVTVRTLRD